MRTLIVLQWLVARAGLGPRPAGGSADHAGTTADRAGRLVPVPDEALEPEMGRSLVENGALWLLIGFVLVVVGAGYVRRRRRGRSGGWPVWARVSRFSLRRPR